MTLKPRLSSPGLLLIIAVVAAGGIYLTDLFFFEPYVQRQTNLALREQAGKAEKTGRWVLRMEADRLRGLCRSLGRDEGLSGILAGRGPRGALADKTAGLQAVDAAWLSDAAGSVVGCWSQADWGLSQEVVAESLAALYEPAGGLEGLRVELGETGLMRLGAEAALYARCRVDSPAGGQTGELWLVRRLAGALLAEMGSAISGEVVLIPSDRMPGNMLGGQAGPSAAWPIRPDRLAVAWQAVDAAGSTLGYFRADLSVIQIHHQAASVRRTILLVLSLSVGALVLVIMGAGIFLANPLDRLLNRVHRAEAGDYIPDDFTRNLHAEPLMLARRLQKAFKAMTNLSKTDDMTGLANRRQFDQMLHRSLLEARRYHRAMSVLVMDIDLFKAINDTAGHQAGDELLKEVGGILRKCCRKADLPARFGGDEFAVLLPETPSGGAAVVAERIRKSVSSRTMVLNNSEIKMTVSIGIADMNAGKVGEAEDLMALADRALYAAKQQGRNRCVQAHDLGEGPIAAGPDDADRTDALKGKLAGLDTQFKALFVRALQEIVQALDRRDPHMADHARKVQHYAVLIARQMKLTEEQIKLVELSALLHDIGMLGLPDEVALCPGRLSGEQFEVLKRHPLIGARILEGTEFLEQVIPPVRSHHERFDGKGYPQGLTNEAIPLAARIVAVADSYDAMTSPRAFRGAKSREEALLELRSGAGQQFDPAVVTAFLAAAERLGERLGDMLASQSALETLVMGEPEPAPSIAD